MGGFFSHHITLTQQSINTHYDMFKKYNITITPDRQLVLPNGWIFDQDQNKSFLCYVKNSNNEYMFTVCECGCKHGGNIVFEKNKNTIK